MKMKKKQVLASFALCALVLAGCSTGGGDKAKTESGDKAKKQEINVVVQQEMHSGDLSLATDTISFTALNNVYEGLYRLDKKDQPQPAGAEKEAEVSQDGTTYTVKLRKDAKWSNGDPVTAKDYVYGWQRTADPKTAAEYAYLYALVKNGEAIINGEKPVSELGIKAVDDYTLEIQLEKATPYFPYLMAFPSFFPQHEATVKEFGDAYATKSDKSVYNGPFVLDGFDGPGTDTEWAYKKNDTYWDAKNVKLDKVNVNVVKESSTSLNLFKDGQADDVILTGELAKQMKNDPAYVTQPEARTTYLEVNQRDEKSPYRNANLRKAFSYAIDRKSLVNNILGDGSAVATGLVPTGNMTGPDGKDFTEDSKVKVTYDKKKAKEYWNKAKQELGIDSLTIELVSDDTDATKKVSEYLQSSLQDTLDGVKVNLTPVPFSVRLDRGNKGQFDMIVSGWAADYLDASSFTDLFVTGNSYNRGRWSNAEYDKLVDASGNADATDEKKRWDDLLGAEKVILDESGVIPVFYKSEAHLRNPKVKGIVAHPAGAQYEYKWVEVK